MKKTLFALISTTLIASFNANASGHNEVRHFAGDQSATLEQALENFSSNNKQVAQLLKGEVSEVDMAKIHELTYSLENALEKIRKDLDSLADTLENLHNASEVMKRDEVIKEGQKYISTAQKVVK
ncbi:MAG: hypothetical protein GX049_00340 [Alcaligenaceae bacterium]|nr:hypothetical protein [Alcaligenaceae bacterium]